MKRPNRHRVVLSQVGLPTTYAADAFDDLLHTMALDKKARGSTLRFVILNGLASAEILAAPEPRICLRAAYAAVASYGAASVGNRAPTHGGGESGGVFLCERRRRRRIPSAMREQGKKGSR